MVDGNCGTVSDSAEADAIQAISFVRMHDGGTRAELSALLRFVGKSGLDAAVERGWIFVRGEDAYLSNEGYFYYEDNVRISERPGLGKEKYDMHRVRDGLRWVDEKFTIYDRRYDADKK